MKCVISVIVLCVLMFHVSNIVKEVNGQDSKCKTYMRYPGKCGADGNKKCQGEMRDFYITYNRCDCKDTWWRNKEYHDCNCYIKPPCP
ncbi:unnamed protein product [Thlaspi arvense]|uniref:Uncharacterized protein n=1 Tax=Thlaspi arvense TaxID=13288 RepID=A0AAU9RWS8_THLAR|nr:unnamed protein product [Thlaspi arvense]